MSKTKNAIMVSEKPENETTVPGLNYHEKPFVLRNHYKPFSDLIYSPDDVRNEAKHRATCDKNRKKRKAKKR
jgi:hypothetical protein